jgi:hypothetical protein
MAYGVDASCTALLADRESATPFGWAPTNIEFDLSTLEKASVFFTESQETI